MLFCEYWKGKQLCADIDWPWYIDESFIVWIKTCAECGVMFIDLHTAMLVEFT